MNKLGTNFLSPETNCLWHWKTNIDCESPPAKSSQLQGTVWILCHLMSDNEHMPTRPWTCVKLHQVYLPSESLAFLVCMNTIVDHVEMASILQKAWVFTYVNEWLSFLVKTSQQCSDKPTSQSYYNLGVSFPCPILLASHDMTNTQCLHLGSEDLRAGRTCVIIRPCLQTRKVLLSSHFIWVFLSVTKWLIQSQKRRGKHNRRIFWATQLLPAELKPFRSSHGCPTGRPKKKFAKNTFSGPMDPPFQETLPSPWHFQYSGHQLASFKLDKPCSTK